MRDTEGNPGGRPEPPGKATRSRRARGTSLGRHKEGRTGATASPAGCRSEWDVGKLLLFPELSFPIHERRAPFPLPPRGPYFLSTCHKSGPGFDKEDLIQTMQRSSKHFLREAIVQVKTLRHSPKVKKAVSSFCNICFRAEGWHVGLGMSSDGETQCQSQRAESQWLPSKRASKSEIG